MPDENLSDYMSSEPLDADALRAALAVARETLADVEDEILRDPETREAALRLSQLIPHRLRVTS